jgi:hypothetical protein
MGEPKRLSYFISPLCGLDFPENMFYNSGHCADSWADCALQDGFKSPKGSLSKGLDSALKP